MMTIETIILTPEDQALVVSLAERRTQDSRESGYVDRKCSPDDGNHIDLLGMGGELAFARMKNLKPDLSGKRNDYDCLYNGKTIDVKTTEAKNGKVRLNVSGNKYTHRCDWYVLMLCDWPTFQLVGCAPESMVFDPKYERPNAYGKPGTYFSINASDLLSDSPIEQMELNK